MGNNYPAILENLYEMLQFIKDEAHSSGFNQTYISKIELAAEEALVNIINHGYPGKRGTINISCEHLENNGLGITITDEGIPFDPLEAIKNFKPSDSIRQDMSTKKQLGGYGIYFIVNMMDKVSYKRADGCNILTLIKYHTLS